MTARLLVLEGGAPWGFRIQGGVDLGYPLKISRVNPGSKAATSGVREGDLITSINGVTTRDSTNSEAHGLLRNAGATLRLGLNEDSDGSPKRRQFRTIHQETHQETVKRSSITSYSLEKTEQTVQTKRTNESDISNTNENTINRATKTPPSDTVVQTRPTIPSASSTSSSSTSTLKEDLRNISSDNAEASQRSSYTNCTLSPTNSVFSEEGYNIRPRNNRTSLDNMNDTPSNASKSKRRRHRRRNRKQSPRSDTDTDSVEVDSETTIEEEEYIVNSPVELKKTPNKTKKPIKSRSLDDEEVLQIQELTEVSEIDDKDKENQAIISEASESEVEWEETVTLPTLFPSQGTLSTLTLPLDSYSTVQVTLISPEEEKTLRNFLERLHLVNGPEEAAKQIDDLNTIESIKQRKARKRAELEQYFLPFLHNPRHLDVISEEDTDREQASLTKNLKQGTPDLDIPPKVPPRPKRQNRRTLPKAFASPVEQAPAILVDAKLVDSTRISEGFCSTMQAEEATSDVEVVYLDDSSGSNTPEELNNTNISIDVEDNGAVKSDANINDDALSTQKTGNFTEETSTTEQLPGGFETITTTTSTKCNFTVKTNQANKNEVDTNIISELTPPPTPDSISPMNEKVLTSNNEKQIVIPHDSSKDTSQLENNTKISSPEVVPSNQDAVYKRFIENQASVIHTNIISPPPPPIRSSSSSTSSSRGSSLCTAKYIPTTSSLTDMTVLTEETYYRPATLRESCLKFLVTLPFGKEILQELAETSKTLDSYTKSFPQPLSPQIVPNLAQFVSSTKKETNHVPSELSDKKSVEQMKKEDTCFNERNIPITKEWLETTGNTFDKWKQLKGLTEPNPRNWVRSFSEIDILNEKHNLEKTDNIPREVNIPIKREWVSQQYLDTIPIRKDNQDQQTKPREERRASFPTIAQWTELRNTLDRRQALEALSCLKKETIIPIIKEWTKKDTLSTPLYKEWVHNPNKTKEINIPIKLDWNTVENTQKDTKYKEWVPSSTVEDSAAMASKPKEVNIPITKEWVGIPTEADPNLLLCLSPKQKEELEKCNKIPNEAENLLDLHNKFLNRTSHEEFKKTQEENVTITNVTRNSPNALTSNSSRLLTIIREEPNVGTSNEDNKYLYFVEKDPKDGAKLHTNVTNARLKARDLTEWLNLARSKSMSESNLSNVPAIPENNLRDIFNTPPPPKRRVSLPYDLYERQMYYLQEKEREIQKQLQDLEQERRKINSEMSEVDGKNCHLEDFKFSPKGDYAENKKRPVSMPMMPTEFFRQQMYEEYLDKCAAREERQQHKVIKISSSKDLSETSGKEIIHPIKIEKEFMDKVKQKQREGILESSKSLDKEGSVDKETEEGAPILVMNGAELKEAKKLPKHLQEFVQITKQINKDGGIWSPGQKQEIRQSPTKQELTGQTKRQDDPIVPIWTPKSANSSPTPTAERKEFKSVNFQSPVLSRKARTKSENLGSESPSSGSRWKFPDYSSDTGVATTSFEKRLTSSQSSPASGFGDTSPSPRLPRAQNPTSTLLQKAREGHLPRGAAYLEQESQKLFKPKNDRPPIANPGEILYQIKNEYTSEPESGRPRKMTELGPRKFEGIGPVAKDGMPLILRSEVKDQNQSKWYKRMYDTIHKQKPHSAQYPYSSGYLSEPEPGAYDSDFTEYKYQTLDRRRPPMLDTPTNYTSSTMPRNTTNKSLSTDVLRTSLNTYKKHPGRIENYTPGHSSISEKEAREWWDEVMDIFDGHLEQQKRYPQRPKSFINQALKESGYESDSTLVFRRREEAANQQLSPKEQREIYKSIQKGGDVPLHGLRKLAPERPKETELVEFFPISPTLTRIRVHKNITPPKEVVCYPVTVHHQPQNTFSAYKRTAPSSASLPNIPTPPPIPPPSPPRRRSSRNNPTLRLVSTMKVKSEKSSSCKRHETCFTTTSKVNFLRDKITCKLSPTLSKRSSSPKMKVIKKITTSPDIKNRITSTITTSKDSKTSTRRVQSKTNVYNSVNRSKSCDTVRNLGKKIPSNESLHLGKSPTKTFGTEKRKFDLGLQSCRIAKSPDLLSPTEVKKATGTIYKKTNAVLASTKNSKAKELLPIKVGITDKAKSVLKPSVPVSPKLSRKSSPSPSSASDRSRIDSLSSPKLQRKPKEITKVTKTKPREDKSSQKSKKEQINDEIAKKERPSSSRTKKDKVKKCLGKAEGTGILKKLKDIDGVTTSLKDIKRQKEVIQSNHFFQHLFLRDVSPTPSNTSRNSWLIEKTNQLQRRRSSFSEPSIGAMKVYLKHTRPVSDSKFISLDIATMRSRSASPKSVTFDDAADKTLHKRSTSLPPKLIFSQTSRPLSPVIHYKKLHTPPQSPKLSRSPSSRKIMQYKQIQSDKKEGHDYSFYMCPNLNYSNTSLDSLKSEEYQRYFNECLIATKKSDRFKDLNQFYEGIKKVGELEKATNLKPRKKSENEIIDFDRWKEVRTRERAEEELGILYNKIKENEKEKGFLYLPKDVNKYKWKKELDRGLRIKEKSVDDIKEEFENIKRDDSQRENAKRREISSLKDTYKPLWRGNSVANIASNIAERRSQSEGRVKTPKQRLLDQERVFTQGIGSRIWSSLSMEQVNILKDQLAEIYNSTKPPPQDYTVQVLAKDKRMLPTTLSVRRNSDSSTGEQRYRDVTPTKMTYMSENDKKTISQTLSKELLEKIAKQRKKNKTALPLVVGKEILGAVAAADANLKTTLTELPPRPLIKTDVLHQTKTSTSETESGSTDESTKTVINVDPNEDIKKKVEYFEKVKEHEPYTPTIYKAADDVDETGVSQEKPALEPKLFQSKSCQSIKEFYGENDLVKFATIPLSATRKHKFSPRKPELRSSEISPIRSEFSMNTSQDSLPRSRSSSPYLEETKALAKTGEVNRLKNKFEYWEDMYGNITLKRSRSESDLSKVFPVPNIGYVDSLRRKYEYPAYSGRGRSRTRRGGVVSPLFLKAEDRFMPHINIISKIASLYSKQNIKNDKDRQRSMEELADILGCPVGEVEKLRDKFDSSEDISLVGHMYTSSPSIRELKDIAPYLAADWTAHKYPRYEDNTRSLSSPETSLASRDTSLVRKAKTRPKSISPPAKAKPSILKPVQQQHRSTDFSQNSTYDPKRHEPTARYQPSDVARGKETRETRAIIDSSCQDVSSSVDWRYREDPEPPLPPPKGQHTRNFETESPRKYVENEVTIHYKTPVRQEIKDYISEDELAYRQAENMRKIYQEERRKKYLQELQDINARRHTDNFIPSQKSPISLNRYDDFDDLAPSVKPRPRSPEPRLVARALYNFVGQTARELTFRKGDLIYVRRQVDKNWYEGELNAMVGLFPTNYVEIVPYEGVKTTPRKSHEGQARAKYNFLAQTHLELSLAKGELVVVTRKVDDNWFEGKIGGRKGIFPASYVDVLIDPQEPPPANPKPVASPASHSLLLNGSAGGKESMGAHCYTPSTSYPPAKASATGSIGRKRPSVDEALHIETQSEPIAYRALYKYAPQNDDELELLEGDTVYVLEKCDDGWYVGSSNRTGAFGTFPGNYVEKI